MNLAQIEAHRRAATNFKELVKGYSQQQWYDASSVMHELNDFADAILELTAIPMWAEKQSEIARELVGSITREYCDTLGCDPYYAELHASTIDRIVERLPSEFSIIPLES